MASGAAIAYKEAELLREELKQKYFQNGLWYTDEEKTILATPEQTAIYQEQRRTLKYNAQALLEIDKAKYGSFSVKAKYRPLVERRTNTNQKDFSLFSFPEGHAKHTKGNWECSACVRTGLELTLPSEEKNTTSKPLIEFCPHFLSPLRHLNYSRYREISTKCFAGLVHTDMMITATHVIIKKKCDTCDYYLEEKKEFKLEEQASGE